MAFPVVEDKIATGRGTETTSPVSYPATVSVGATLVCIARSDNMGTTGWPAGWNELVETESDGSDDTTAIAWRKAVGNEDGTTFNVTHGNGKSAYIVYSITGATDPTVTPPQISTVAIGSSTLPDPTSLSPTGGAKDYLWLWLGGWEGEPTSPPAGNPTNYTNPLGASTGVAGQGYSNCCVASAERNLNAVSEDPPSWTVSLSVYWSAWTMAVHPAGGVTVVPGVASLTTTRYTPTVTVSNNQVVTPGVASLTTTRFTPSVILGTGVVPGTASLVTTRFTPTVSVSNNITVTPGLASLTTTRYTPSVVLGTVVIPGVVALTTTRYIPTVTVGGGGQTVIPGVASLVTTRFTPSVVLGTRVIPGVASLTTTRYAPSVVLNTIIVPGVVSLTTTRFTPVVAVSNNQVVIPGVASLTTTRFIPVVTTTANVIVTPGVVALTATRYAPAVVLGTIISPGVGALTLTRYTPVILVSQNVQVTPGVASLILTRFVPLAILYTPYGGAFLWTAANWGVANIYFEVYFRATAGTVYAQLWNSTDNVAVASSQLNTTSSSFVRLRTSALTLSDSKLYRVQFGKQGGSAGEFLAAKLVIN